MDSLSHLDSLSFQLVQYGGLPMTSSDFLVNLKGTLVYYDVTIVVLAIVANIVVLIAVLCSKFSQTQTFYRYFLVSLASCDLFSSMVNLFSMFYQLYPTWAASSRGHGVFQLITKCVANVLRTLQLCGFLTNLLNLSAMSIDHYFFVKYPVRYISFMNKKVAGLGILLIWTIAFGFAFLDVIINVAAYHTLGGEYDQNSGGVTPRPQQPLRSPDLSEDQYFSLVLQGLEFDPGNMSAPAEVIDVPDDGDYLFGLNDDFRSNGDSAAVLRNMFQKLQDDELVQENMCTFFSVKKMWFELCVLCFVVVCFSLFLYCYIGIFKTVTARDAHGHRARRLICTTLIFIGAFTACWIPFMVFEFAMFFAFKNQHGAQNARSNVYKFTPDPLKNAANAQIESDQLINDLLIVQAIFLSLMKAYQFLDPLIYAVRVPVVKEFLIRLFIKCVPCSSWEESLKSYLPIYRNSSPRSRLNSMTLMGRDSMRKDPTNNPNTNGRHSTSSYHLCDVEYRAPVTKSASDYGGMCLLAPNIPTYVVRQQENYED